VEDHEGAAVGPHATGEQNADIARPEVDAIVNAANPVLLEWGGAIRLSETEHRCAIVRETAKTGEPCTI
jgi:O-acetyl-ADP-ribose deacetylase (regulator of RNase III)